VNAETLKEINEEEIETGLTFLGGTGLEDLLQDNVANCIRDFREAAVKVWMLTGDKKETAKNIAISCGLLDTVNTTSVDISAQSPEELHTQFDTALKRLLEGDGQDQDKASQGDDFISHDDVKLSNQNKNNSLLIQGTSLHTIYEN
jgi:magnesium-transporting ATPase (P-type)